jgi:hypothetical protein
VFEECRQDLEGLFLEANSQAVLAQFAGTKIQLENPKTEAPANLMVFLHGKEISAKRECTTRKGNSRWGYSPVGLLWTDSYQGTLIPAGRNCQSIASILRREP